jgi:hypothetical protein
MIDIQIQITVSGCEFMAHCDVVKCFPETLTPEQAKLAIHRLINGVPDILEDVRDKSDGDCEKLLRLGYEIPLEIQRLPKDQIVVVDVNTGETKTVRPGE